MSDSLKAIALFLASSGIMALLITVAIHMQVRYQFACLWLAFSVYTVWIVTLIIVGREK